MHLVAPGVALGAGNVIKYASPLSESIGVLTTCTPSSPIKDIRRAVRAAPVLGPARVLL